VIEIRPLDSPDERTLERLPFSRLGSPGGEYLVAWEDGEPVGHAHVDWQHDPPELQDVFVPEPLRRRGIGTALTAAAAQRAVERGHRSLGLEVADDDAAALALYERLGFRKTGRTRRVKGTVVLRTGPIEVDDTLLGMVKTLE
jgi:ribosomal protein S18 acetylase RimI-like enzyme